MRSDCDTVRFGVKTQLALIALITCLSCDSSSPDEAAPFDQVQTTTSTQEVDFGARPGGSTGIIDFQLSNATTHDLIIEKVVAACGCTVINDFNRNVPAMQSVPMQATVQFPRLHSAGPFSSSITVTFAGGTSKSVLLKGRVIPELPEALLLNDLRPGDRRSTTVVINPIRSDTLFTVIESIPKFINAKVERVDSLNTGAATRVEVIVDAPSSLGDFEGKIILAASDDLGQRVLHVSGRVIGDFTVEPASLYVGQVTNAHSSKQLVVRQHAQKGSPDWFRRLKVKSSNPAVTAKILLPRDSSAVDEVIVEIWVDGTVIQEHGILNALVDLTIEPSERDGHSAETHRVNVVAVK